MSSPHQTAGRRGVHVRDYVYVDVYIYIYIYIYTHIHICFRYMSYIYISLYKIVHEHRRHWQVAVQFDSYTFSQ